MTFADSLPDKTRKNARRHAILSAIFGCVSEQAIDTSTMLVLYLSILGGKDAFTMLATAISGLALTALSIPSAGLINRWGLRVSYSASTYLQTLMFMIIAGAPFFGSCAGIVVMAAFAGFCVLRAFYAATWFPITDNFLRADERGGFFGTMRFAYMFFYMLLVFGIGNLMGNNPPIWILQLFFLFAGLGLLVRKYYLDKLPIAPDPAPVQILPSLKISLGNRPLVGFSFYIGFLNLAALNAFPLAIIYMRSHLGYGAFWIMAITAVGVLGQIIGYAATGGVVRKVGIKYFELMTHLIFIAVIGALLLTSSDRAWSLPLMFVLFFFNGVAFAFLNCVGSVEMLALARPGNKVMAMALVTTFQNLGNALGRLGVTLLLSVPILAPQWEFGGRVYSRFHTLFLFDFLITGTGLLFFLLTPAFIPRGDDYYQP